MPMANNPTQNPATLEEAREMLLQNKTELDNLKEQVSNLTAQISEKDENIESLRTLNQKFYLQLSQGQASDPEPEDEEPQSLEDFARNLKGVIK